jgi:hypothetical protein
MNNNGCAFLHGYYVKFLNLTLYKDNNKRLEFKEPIPSSYHNTMKFPTLIMLKNYFIFRPLQHSHKFYSIVLTYGIATCKSNTLAPKLPFLYGMRKVEIEEDITH